MCCGEAEAELAARNSIQRQVESGICVSLLSVLLSAGDEVGYRCNIIRDRYVFCIVTSGRSTEYLESLVSLVIDAC